MESIIFVISSVSFPDETVTTSHKTFVLARLLNFVYCQQLLSACVRNLDPNISFHYL